MVEEKTSLEVSARYLQGPIFPRVKVKIRLGLVLGLSLVVKVVIVTFGDSGHCDSKLQSVTMRIIAGCRIK